MTMLFGICATVGVTLLVCQLVLTVVGVGGSDDIDGGGVDVGHDMGGHVHAGDHHGHSTHGSNWFFGVITFRTLTAAVAFFGLCGLGLNSMGASTIATFSGALLAGAGAMYLVHWMMNSLAYLKADGTTRIDRAVGGIGTVYVTIPGNNTGLGKVTINLQSRTVELEARTPNEKLPTGAKVVVTRLLGGEVVEVVAAISEAEEVSV
jgi:hypothetical protein